MAHGTVGPAHPLRGLRSEFSEVGGAVLVVGFGFFAISTYLRFKELELKYARLARAIALNEADQRDHRHPSS